MAVSMSWEQKAKLLKGHSGCSTKSKLHKRKARDRQGDQLDGSCIVPGQSRWWQGADDMGKMKEKLRPYLLQKASSSLLPVLTPSQQSHPVCQSSFCLHWFWAPWDQVLCISITPVLTAGYTVLTKWILFVLTLQVTYYGDEHQWSKHQWSKS
jgi:hypothetical protein